jgi:tetratricopeptide (TPR) repeat protein
MSMQIDTHALPPGASGRQQRAWALLTAVALVALGVSGCAPPRGYSSVVVTPSQSRTVSPAPSREPSLAAIISNQLQLGHYAEGEHALQQYLKQHPGDRAAQAMLRQLVVDPRQVLGERWRAHVVQLGDSYSTLAGRYLGDPNRFLILARYNGSTNPSMLRAGETLRMPLPAGAEAGATAAAESSAAATMPTAIVRGSESPAAEARRLQSEGVSLLGQGHKDQALARLDQALAIDPRLKPAGAGATALRTQLLDSYHERAIVLYRDQQLDQAIALWDRVLAIAPDYEPAIVYRTRARELKQRLKQY